MKVGELIDLLTPFRGRGDEVIIWNIEMGEVSNITGVAWDDIDKVVEIFGEIVETYDFR